MMMIENGIKERKKTELTELLHKECVQHVRFAQERCQLFHGRRELLQGLKEKAKESKYVNVPIKVKMPMYYCKINYPEKGTTLSVGFND